MKKEELKNAIVEMNLLKLITDKELIMINNRIKKHFLNASSQDETPKVITNEDKEEVCGYVMYPITGCAYHDNRSCVGCHNAKTGLSAPSKGHL